MSHATHEYEYNVFARRKRPKVSTANLIAAGQDANPHFTQEFGRHLANKLQVEGIAKLHGYLYWLIQTYYPIQLADTMYIRPLLVELYNAAKTRNSKEVEQSLVWFFLAARA